MARNNNIDALLAQLAGSGERSYADDALAQSRERIAQSRAASRATWQAPKTVTIGGRGGPVSMSPTQSVMQDFSGGGTRGTATIPRAAPMGRALVPYTPPGLPALTQQLAAGPTSAIPMGPVTAPGGPSFTAGAGPGSASRLGQAATALPASRGPSLALGSGSGTAQLATQLAPAARAGSSMSAAQAAAAGRAAFGVGAVPAAAPAAATGRLGAMLGTGGRLAAGGIGRAGLYGAAGAIAGQLVPESGASSMDEGLTGALTGAGLGASVGSLIAPGLGTAIGGGLGALAGGAIGLFGPKSTGNAAVHDEYSGQMEKLTALMDSQGLDAESRRMLIGQVDAGLFGANSKGQVRDIFGQVATLMPQMLLEQQARQQEQADLEAQDADRSARAAAIQSYLMPMLQQQTRTSDLYAQQLATTQRAAADSISDPTLSGLYRALADQGPLMNAQANTAHLAQLGYADSAFRTQAEMAAQYAREAAELSALGGAPSAANSSVEALLAQLG
jgi:hypothetical protein